MSYEEANELSLEEIPFMDDVRDPVWVEDDRRNGEYIKIHGEVELDDDEWAFYFNLLEAGTKVLAS